MSVVSARSRARSNDLLPTFYRRDTDVIPTRCRQPFSAPIAAPLRHRYTRPMLDRRANAPDLPPEIARRRTFAIISHPDAGKTTLTEKFLL